MTGDQGFKSHGGGAPIKLTKERPLKPNIPIDDFKVRTFGVFEPAPLHCTRYVEHEGKSYAITYWNCPKLPDYSEANSFIFLCRECKMITWVEVEV